MPDLLTYSDRMRLMARDLEFRAPLSFTRAAIGVGALKSPYTPMDDTLRAIFIHIPKAAGTSLRRSLYGCKSYHIPATRYRAADQSRFDTYFKFCLARNPWDRLHSAFQYLWTKRAAGNAFRDYRWAADHLSGCNDFGEFVRRLDDDEVFCLTIRRYFHFRDQADWITAPGSRHLPLVDFIGRYEQLGEDFNRLEQRLGLKTPLAAERIRYDRRDYRRVYDRRMIDIVARTYRADIDLLGYDFE